MFFLKDGGFDFHSHMFVVVLVAFKDMNNLQ